jgi:acyl carrier protein
MLSAHLAGEVARVLGLSPERRPDRDRGFFDMGMDSLMAVELKKRLEASLERPLSPSVVFDYPTVERLARHLSGALGLDPEPSTAAGREAESGTESLAGAVEQLSDEEAAALLDDALDAIDRENPA